MHRIRHPRLPGPATPLATPDSVYDADLDTGELHLLKRKPVLPGQAGDDPGDYEQHREWAPR